MSKIPSLVRSSLRAVGALVFVGLTVLAGLCFRPWATFKPSVMNSMFDADRRVDTFRRMDQVFAKRDVAASDKPLPFQPGTPMTLPAGFSHLTEQVSTGAFLKETDTTSLIVLKNGRLVAEHYFLGSARDSRFTSWSMAKSYIGTLVGMAVRDGKIQSIDEPLSAYLPELRGKPYGESSIKSALQMASGVSFDEAYHHPLSDINWLFYRTFIAGQRVNDVVANRARVRPPGTEFDYISSDSQVLSALVVRVYGQPLAKVLEEQLWKPLGAEHSAYWSLDKDSADGQELGFCCLNATSLDFAKLGQLMLQGGEWQGRQLLPRAWVEQATRPAGAWQAPQSDDENDLGYAYQWWVPGWSAGGQQTEVLARGVWGQNIYINEPLGVVVVRTAVDPEYGSNSPKSLSLYRHLARLAR